MSETTPLNGTGLCLSGGGYRAMLFHLGTLIRLNETGRLRTIDRVSSVSGGSITAGMLALKWDDLNWGADNVARSLMDLVVAPIRNLASHTIDESAILGGMFSPFATIGEKVADAYDKYLFKKADLQALPDTPRFVINATNVQTGVLFRFSKPYMGDYLIGRVHKPNVKLSTAVAASSAFPPVLSPLVLDTRAMTFVPDKGSDLCRPPFTETVVLSDGGVYDNMGIEPVIGNFKTILVSDAGAAFRPEEDPKGDWARHSMRVMDLVDEQVRKLRRRMLWAEMKHNKDNAIAVGYWRVSGDPSEYPAISEVSKHLTIDKDYNAELAATATRLKELDDETQEGLINLGYLMCTVATESFLPPPPIAVTPKYPYS